MRTIFLITVLFAAACGGDDGGSAGDDTGGGSDAGGGSGSDAGSSAKQIGSPCTQDQANPTGPGDCGTGFTCLGLQGGAGAFCTKACTSDAAGQGACNAVFTGPGVSACILAVATMAGGATTNYCGIICEATDMASCPDCNSTCPAPLTCSAPLMNSGGMTLGKACK
ncbi:hypothetical protein BH11MYX2_BH11MYX2_31910 [soil metagenome]